MSRAIDPKVVGHEMALFKLPITPAMAFRALVLAQKGDLQPPRWQNEWPLR
jgi:hypothetical protein